MGRAARLSGADQCLLPGDRGNEGRTGERVDPRSSKDTYAGEQAAGGRGCTDPCRNGVPKVSNAGRVGGHVAVFIAVSIAAFIAMALATTECRAEEGWGVRIPADP